MTARSSIAEQLELQSVVTMESTIPIDMTIEQWRRRRRPPPTSVFGSVQWRLVRGKRRAA
jgi:hypothetical protein